MHIKNTLVIYGTISVNLWYFDHMVESYAFSKLSFLTFKLLEFMTGIIIESFIYLSLFRYTFSKKFINIIYQKMCC